MNAIKISQTKDVLPSLDWEYLSSQQVLHKGNSFMGRGRVGNDITSHRPTTASDLTTTE